MDTFSFILTILGFLGSLALGAGIVWARFKLGTDQTSNESNELLRKLVDDLKDEQLRIRQRLHDTENTLTAIQVKLDVMTKKSEFLERLINAALLDYFAKEPGLITTVKETITGAQQVEDK